MLCLNQGEVRNIVLLAFDSLVFFFKNGVLNIFGM